MGTPTADCINHTSRPCSDTTHFARSTGGHGRHASVSWVRLQTASTDARLSMTMTRCPVDASHLNRYPHKAAFRSWFLLRMVDRRFISSSSCPLPSFIGGHPLALIARVVLLDLCTVLSMRSGLLGMQSIAFFSTLIVLIVAQQDGQQWGINFAPSNSDSNGLNGFFSGITGFFEDLGNAITFGGPSFLRNVTRQGRQDYYKILQNKTLTRTQIQTAVGNWADANNVTSQVNAYNSKKQTEKNQFRSNVTSAVQQLPNLISQLNAIDENQNLTPSQAADQTRQTIRNATQPFLRDLVFDVLPPSSIGSAIGGAFDAKGDDNNNSSEEDGDIFSRK